MDSIPDSKRLQVVTTTTTLVPQPSSPKKTTLAQYKARLPATKQVLANAEFVSGINLGGGKEVVTERLLATLLHSFLPQSFPFPFFTSTHARQPQI